MLGADGYVLLLPRFPVSASRSTIWAIRLRMDTIWFANLMSLLRYVRTKRFGRMRQNFKRILHGGSVRRCVELSEQTSQFKNSNLKSPSSTGVKNILRNSIFVGVRTFVRSASTAASPSITSTGLHKIHWCSPRCIRNTKRKVSMPTSLLTGIKRCSSYWIPARENSGRILHGANTMPAVCSGVPNAIRRWLRQRLIGSGSHGLRITTDGEEKGNGVESAD